MARPLLLSWIELSRSALRHNIASLAKLAGNRKLAICVKANAYGHGLPEIVGLLEKDKRVDYVTVHSLEEAIICREHGWSRRIMLLGPLPPGGEGEVFEHDLEPSIFNRSTLTAIGRLGDKRGKSIRTHLKLECGTNRQGLTTKELPKIAELYKRYRALKKPYGASTHFANIEDTTNHEYARQQLASFNRMIKELTRLGIRPSIRHTACSAAMILFNNTRFDLVRPGISAYGYWSSKETYLSYRLSGGGNNLFRPVLTWKCRLTQLKKLPQDSFVGYGCTFRTTSSSRLAVLPIGYADGYDRRLSNIAHVLVRGRRAPVRGRVCMNLTMIDLTDISGVKLHDAVTIIGNDGSEQLSADQLAQWTGSINYEILARITPILPRVITD